MSLTGEQYNEIMGVLSQRRSNASYISSKRQEEVDRLVPAVRVINEDIARLQLKEVMSRVKGRTAGSAEISQKSGQEGYAGKLKELRNKRNEALRAAGFPGDYLSPQYYCSQCSDTGYIGREKCGCLKKLESQILNRESGLPKVLEKENFSTFNKDVFDNTELIEELLPDYRATQYTYMRDIVMAHVRHYLEAYSGKTSSKPGNVTGESKKNLIFTGPAGTGKTFLCNCIARLLIDKRHTVMYERAGELFARMTREAFSREKDVDFESRERRIESCELLIIDDLGTEFTTDYTKSRLFTLISNRLTAGRSTIISTNLSLAQLQSVYGERMASRFRGEYSIVPFYGKDVRLNRRQS